MGLRCVACQQLTDDTQPYYCTRCFIPAPVFKDGHYIGLDTAYCPECHEELDNRQKCSNCNHRLSFLDPPQPAPLSKDMQIREKNRQKLAKEVLADNRMTQQVIEMLGIDHLPRDQQGVALSALAREKMNFLSVEYNLTEAHTLVDMAHAITEEEGEDWATQLTGMRLGTIYYRKGMAMQAVKTFSELYQQAPQQTQIQQFRKIELLAHLALAHRLGGNAQIATEAAHQAHEQTLLMYQQMESTIEDMIKNQNTISQYMGLDESGVTYPRVDYVFTILVILAEEAIARGGVDQLRIREVALDRLMELDNIIKILGNITPDDDTTYYGSHMRDYVRIFNGLLWYGDLLLPNAHTRRRYLIEQYYERIDQWSYLLPPAQWLPLRPARFFEIFLRAEQWADFSTKPLIDRLLKHSPDEVRARWDYVMADAMARVGRVKEAIEYLDIILKETEPYVTYADDELKALAQQLYNAIHLESIGIIVGLQDPGSDWINLPLAIQLEEVKDYLEPESYLRSETQPPLLRMAFEEPPEGQNIAIFGDKLLQAYDAYPAIKKVGERDYRDLDWTSTGAAGIRTDVAVLRVEMSSQTISLLFEGYDQEIVDGELQPSRLMVLRGIIHQYDMTHQDVLDTIIDLMAEPEQTKEFSYLFTLKSTFEPAEDDI